MTKFIAPISAKAIKFSVLFPKNHFYFRKRMTEAKQKTSEARTFVEEQVAERERVRAAKEKMKVQITKAVKIQVRTSNITNTYRRILYTFKQSMEIQHI